MFRGDTYFARENDNFAEELKNHSFITKISFLRFTDRNKKEFGKLMEILKTNKTITQLENIPPDGPPSHRIWLDDEEESHIQIVINCLQVNKHLTKLFFVSGININYCDISPLISVFKVNQTLRELTLYWDRKGLENFLPKMLNGLSEVLSLESLNLFYFNFTRQDNGFAITKYLETNKTLKRLNLSNNKITNEEAVSIAEALKENNTLTVLNLNENFIGLDGTKAIAEMLAVNTTLKELYLNVNELKDKGTVILVPSLLKNKTLKVLKLKMNSIGNEGGMELINALNDTSLEKINLDKNEFDEMVVCRFAELLKTNKTLTNVSLRSKFIGTKGLDAYDKALKVNKTLKKLSIQLITRNYSPSFVERNLLDTLKHYTLTSLSLKKIDIKQNEDILNSIIQSNTTLMSLTLSDHRDIDHTQMLFDNFENNCSLTKLEIYVAENAHDNLYSILIPKLRTNFALKNLQLALPPEEAEHIKEKNYLLTRNIEFARKVKAFVVDSFIKNKEIINIEHFHIFKIYQKISKISLNTKMINLDIKYSTIIKQLDNHIKTHYFLIRGVCKQVTLGNILLMELFMKIIDYLGPQSLWM